VVLVDESTITYGTLRKLDAFVGRELLRWADLALTVIELPIATTAPRPPGLKSLYKWTPLRVRGDATGVGTPLGVTDGS
jgi:hypothetical protein